MQAAQRIVLIGLSGVGKSSVGRLVADHLGWSMIDTDFEIERAFGVPIPEIFRSHGESAFRAQERKCLLEALGQDHVVISCGAGAAVDPALWTSELLGGASTLVVSLDADPETSLQRLVSQAHAEGADVERPLLAGSDSLAQIVALKVRRQESYDWADITIITDRAPADLIAREIAWVARLGMPQTEPTLVLEAPSGASSIYIAPGWTPSVGELVRRHWPRARRTWIISDDIVGPLHGEPIAASLRDAGLHGDADFVPAGEASKSLAAAGRLYDWLLGGGIERGDMIVALGGGVVGDLAGFVAATTLRGVGLVQIPTSLLAMVDSSVGGKTGIDHPAGKNLIGAFYQPAVVAVDPLLLRTLPPRQVTNGWAEIIKHAIIQPSTPEGARADLPAFIARNRRALAADSPAAISYLVWRNIALKAAVVAADERESGIRAFLNFGHTLGHAIEAADYQLLHGEAIAAGMRGEARIAAAIGACTDAEVHRVDRMTQQVGLTQMSEADPTRVLSLLGSDKKRAAGKLRWVLPASGGGVTIRDDVPVDIVQQALRAVSRHSTRT